MSYRLGHWIRKKTVFTGRDLTYKNPKTWKMTKNSHFKKLKPNMYSVNLNWDNKFWHNFNFSAAEYFFYCMYYYISVKKVFLCIHLAEFDHPSINMFAIGFFLNDCLSGQNLTSPFCLQKFIKSKNKQIFTTFVWSATSNAPRLFSKTKKSSISFTPNIRTLTIPLMFPYYGISYVKRMRARERESWQKFIIQRFSIGLTSSASS